MNNMRVVAIVVGAILTYQGYLQRGSNPTPDGPSPSVVIETAVDTLPEAPTGPVLASSTPLVLILKDQPEDAIKLARAYKGWSELIGRSTKLTNTTQFQHLYVDATKVLLEKHGIAGKYQGKIDKIVNDTILSSFQEKGLTENGALKATPWNDTTREAATKALDAISYQCYQAFLGNS